MPYQGRQPGVGVRDRFIFTATTGQTSFSGNDSNGLPLKYDDAAYVDVFINGTLLVPVTDYTATTKTSVVLIDAAAANDVLEILAYGISSIADTVSASSGGTFAADVTFAGDAIFGDNDKAIFGAGSDLQIYSDGTTSRIYESGSGLLTIRASNFNVNTADGSESYITMVDGGAVTSYHSGTAKIATTSTGIDVTGAAQIDGNATVGTATASTNVEFNLNGVASKAQRIQFQEGGVNRWLLGQGAASETSAFELYNSAGVMSLTVNRSTNLATFANGITLTNGNLTVANGKGIDFSAQTQSSATTGSEILDHYEEGTWTPTCTVGGIGTAAGLYTKIGRVVYVQVALSGFTNTVNNEVLFITSLPFTGGETSNLVGSAMWSNVDKDFAYDQVYYDGSSQFRFYHTINGAFDPIRHVDLDSSSSACYFNATYMVS